MTIENAAAADINEIQTRQNLAGSVIKVCLLFKTQQKLNNSVKMRNTTWSPKRTGILLEFPKKGKKIPTKEDKIRDKIFKQ